MMSEMIASKRNSPDIMDRLVTDRDKIDARLREVLRSTGDTHPTLLKALEHILLGPGKRVRPLLSVLTHRSLEGGKEAAAIDVGVAIELVHTYSLIHDDLPCMDDDSMRRGRPTTHVLFGDATAVLAGDALNALAFQVLGSLTERGAESEVVATIVKKMGKATGPSGLIAGQAWDLDESFREIDIAHLEMIHRLKTGKLFGITMEAAALLADLDEKSVSVVASTGEDLGLAFQIVDDILDEVGTSEELGKTPGKDRVQQKVTYPSLAGFDAAKARVDELIAGVTETMSGLGADRDLLDLIRLIGSRTS